MNSHFLSLTTAVILAGGEGTRIRNKPQGINKVAMPLGGKPMIMYSVELLKKMGFGQIIIVVGYARESVMNIFGKTVDYAYQEERLGTGHAVMCALPVVKSGSEYVVVLNGDDSAFYTQEIIDKLLTACTSNELDFSLLTLRKEDPFGLGRIIRDAQGNIQAIVEEKDTTEEEKLVNEVNLGTYCFKKTFLDKYLGTIKFNPLKHEKYLTDLVGVARLEGRPMQTVCLEDEQAWFGINTDEQLEEANQIIAVSQ